jgi:heptose I phosphotransferase
VSYGSIWERWARGVSWTWVNERYRALVPEDLEVTAMTLESRDRYHAKQGRSTARVILQRAELPLPVYLKRHFQVPWPSRLAALLAPAGRHSPASAEWARLEHVRGLGIDVPDVVAAGERIGPHAGLSSFLMLAELTGRQAINEALAILVDRLQPADLAELKRRVIVEMARITATLHAARVFHKDLYLCHFFMDVHQPGTIGDRARVTLIDLHRLSEHRVWPDWWRWKDLGQLLFSTYGVEAITDRDRRRFWKCYRRLAGIRRPSWHERMIKLRAARYREHNRKPR